MATYTPFWAESRADHARYYHQLFLNRYGVLWTLFPLAALLAVAAHPRPALLAVCVFGVAFVTLIAGLEARAVCPRPRKRTGARRTGTGAITTPRLAMVTPTLRSVAPAAGSSTPAHASAESGHICRRRPAPPKDAKVLRWRHGGPGLWQRGIAVDRGRDPPPQVRGMAGMGCEVRLLCRPPGYGPHPPRSHMGKPGDVGCFREEPQMAGSSGARSPTHEGVPERFVRPVRTSANVLHLPVRQR
jgi:hypothetical protein